MPTEIVRNADRGHLDHGWLKAAHSFGFARYVNPDRRNFGALLVLNEDVIQPGQGFAEHFHDNMEIVTIPLSGALRHGDNMGNGSVVRAGDVQIMSAGTGILHSEHNASETEPVRLLQCWVIPRERGLKTRYDQMSFGATAFRSDFVTVVAPDAGPGHLQIFQDAWFKLADLDAGKAFSVRREKEGNGMFLFVVSGAVRIGTETLSAGDAFTCWEEEAISGMAVSAALLLLIEVPM